MSRTDISVALKAHYAQQVTTLCTCWKVELTNGTTLGFTNHVKDINGSDIVGLADGVTYAASTGYNQSAVETSSSLGVDNLEIHGILDSPAITEADLVAGLWDDAYFEIFEVNYADLTMGRNVIKCGWLGDVSVKGSGFVAELRGLSQRLQQNILEVTTPNCRADLFDSRCKVVKTAGAGWTTIGTVTGVTDQRTIATNLPTVTMNVTASTTGAPPNGHFNNGKIIWITGDNAGLSREVKTYVGGTITMQLPMPYEIQVGDTFTAEVGCQKRIIEDCKTVFDNVINFRGEPYKPTPNSVTRGPARG